MGISLRTTTLVLFPFLIFTTAAVCIGLSLGFSTIAVQDVGIKHAETLASLATSRFEALLSLPLNEIRGLQEATLNLPTDMIGGITTPRRYVDFWYRFSAGMIGSGWLYGVYGIGYADGTYVECVLEVVGGRLRCIVQVQDYLAEFAGTNTRRDFINTTTIHGFDYSIGSYMNRTYDPRKRPWYVGCPKRLFGRKWIDVYMAVNPLALQVAITGTLLNSTGFMGVVAITFKISDLASRVLPTLQTTENTYVALVDNLGTLMATTYPVPFTTTTNLPPNDVTPVPYNCAKSDVSQGAEVSQITCRATLNDYAWPELRQIHSIYNITSVIKISERIQLSSRYFFVTIVKINPSVQADNMDWRFVLLTPEDDVLGEVTKGRNLSLIMAAIVFVVTVGIAGFGGVMITRPMKILSERMDRIANLDLPLEEETNSSISVFKEMKNAQKSMEIMTNSISSFSKYVPLEVVKELLKTGSMAAMGMATTTATISFTDIAKFTNMCQHLNTKTLVEIVGVYFEVMTDVIMAFGGVVDKYIGDAIMAIWGTPKMITSHTVRACAAALTMKYLTTVTKLRRTFNRARARLEIRTGIHQGQCLAGNIGTQRRLNYTVIGDAVNLASRLEAMNKDYGTSIMITEDVMSDLEMPLDFIVLRLLGNVKAIGRDLPTRVYELVGVRKENEQDFDMASSTEIANGSPLQPSSSSRPFSPSDTLDNDDKRDEEMMERFKTMADMPSQDILPNLRRVIGVVPNTTEVFCRKFSETMELYLSRNFANALIGFQELCTTQSVRESDKVFIQQLIADCTMFKENPPGEEWTGTRLAKHK